MPLHYNLLYSSDDMENGHYYLIKKSMLVSSQIPATVHKSILVIGVLYFSKIRYLEIDLERDCDNVSTVRP